MKFLLVADEKVFRSSLAIPVPNYEKELELDGGFRKRNQSCLPSLDGTSNFLQEDWIIN